MTVKLTAPHKAALKTTAIAIFAAVTLSACSSFTSHGHNSALQGAIAGQAQNQMQAQMQHQVKPTDFWSLFSRKTRTASYQNAAYMNTPAPQPAIGPIWSDIYSGQLRPAPRPNYNFAAPAPRPAYRALAYTQPALAPKPQFKHYLDGAYPLPAQAYAPTQAPAQQTAALKPVQSQPVIANPYIARDAYPAPTAAIESLAQAPHPQAQLQTQAPMQAPIQEQAQMGADQQSLSYVKMGGGSDIADWQACETQSGGYFLPAPNGGFTVEPGFDRCMRAKGYKTEAEAQAELELADVGTDTNAGAL